MGPPRYDKRSNRDGDKLLCNRCPLKHEVREVERGEMLYKNTQEHIYRAAAEDLC